MPRIKDYRKTRELVFYDTASMEPGQEREFMGFDARDRVGNKRLTNLLSPQLPSLKDEKTIIFAIGLRIMGTSRDEEDRLLDYFLIEPSIADRPYGPYPGSVCSTLRYVNEDAEADPTKEPMAFVPGYVLKEPLIIPALNVCWVRVLAAETLPKTCEVRVMLFTMHDRSRL